MRVLTALLCAVFLVKAQVSDPPAGACLCMNANGVNVRDSGCGNVIGTANSGECYVYSGNSVPCELNGTPYVFFEVAFGSVMGWIAGDYMDHSDNSMCQSDPPYDPRPGNCGSVSIVTRAEWNARDPLWTIPPLPQIPVTMAFIHHTVTPHCYTEADCIAQVQGIQNYHIDSKGWPDIGYNYLVGEDGQAYEGRGWNKEGAHTYGYNDVAVAVSVIGDFTGGSPKNAALDAVRNILDCAVQEGVLAPDYELFGHRDGGCTACPGDMLYAEIQTWPEYSFRDIPDYCKKP